jgi:hypothetical protein
MKALSSERRTWFVLGLLLACVLSSPARAQKSSQAEVRTLNRRTKRIKLELKGPNNPEWAGVYYHGDGFHVDSILSLAPRSGFVFHCACHLKARDFNYGDLDLTHGTIKLLFTYPPYERKRYDGIAGKFIPIRWGERHYLIGTDELLDFANAVNAGTEPGSFQKDSLYFFLKLGDEEKAVSGEPSLPKEYSRYLLHHPIIAKVSSVNGTQDETRDYLDRDDYGYLLVRVTVDAGSTEGLLEGMTLYVQDPPLLDKAVVTQVSEHTAQAILHLHDYEHHPPARGWALSTQEIKPTIP